MNKLPIASHINLSHFLLSSFFEVFSEALIILFIIKTLNILIIRKNNNNNNNIIHYYNEMNFVFDV